MNTEVAEGVPALVHHTFCDQGSQRLVLPHTATKADDVGRQLLLVCQSEPSGQLAEDASTLVGWHGECRGRQVNPDTAEVAVMDAARDLLQAASCHLPRVVGLRAVTELSEDARGHRVFLDHEVNSPLTTRWRLGRGGWGHPLAPPSMVEVTA